MINNHNNIGLSIEEAFKMLNSNNTELTESFKFKKLASQIPKPYDKYYDIVDYEPEDGDYELGDRIKHYTSHIFAYLELKPEYVDTDLAPDAFLIDDPDYPVCELVGDRLYPVELPEDK